MVVSRNDDVQCACGRLGACDPQVACGEAFGGTPAREAKSKEGQSGGHTQRAYHRLSQPPFPGPSPQVTSEALPYCILRRMSIDALHFPPFLVPLLDIA